MKLRNIHTRKDYKKLYELIGGDQGGVGAKDGFANNPATPGSIVGKMVNGIFKGIGWLWRKSKENFIINKLIAQLINELMRGVILFCLDNNISLTDGKQEIENQEIKSNVSATSSETAITGTTTTGATVSDVSNLDKDALLKRIEDVKEAIQFQLKNVKYLEGNINQNERNLKDIPPKTQAERLKKQKFIDSLKKKLSEAKIELKNSQEELANLENQLKSGQPQPQPQQQAPPQVSFDKIAKACKDKYDFIATSENLPTEAVSLGAFPYTDFVKNFQQRIKPKFVQIGDEYTIIRQGKLTNIKVSDVDTTKGTVSYKIANKEEAISSSKLLPAGFPSLRTIKDQTEAFLKNHVTDYDAMNDKQKKQIEIVYMNYAIINAIREVQKSAISESYEYSEYYEYLVEENLVRNIGSKLAHSSGTAKVKPDESRSGRVGLGKSIAMKAGGVSATVGDILTSRDREKFKEKSDQFKLDIHSVNLAEIEKTVQKLDHKNSSKDKSVEIESVRSKVSSYVNPYNLKMIQISADQLMVPPKEGAVDQNLKLRWDKEVNKVYAGFTNIMDITKVDITKEEYGGKLDNKKVNEKVQKYVTTSKQQETVASVSSKLPVEMNYANLSNLGHWWAFYSFQYGKDLFMTSIAPVESNKGLFKITSCFTDVDDKTHQVTPNDNFKNIFIKNDFDDKTIGTPKQINVYFLMKSDQTFPASVKPRTSVKILILNEFVKQDNSSVLFLKKHNNTSSVTINKNLVDNFKKDEYVYSTSIISCFKFEKVKIDPWMSALHLSRDTNKLDYSEFSHGTPPKFLTKDMENYLKQLIEKI